MADDIDGWRRRIDEIDRELVALLNERAVCAEAIGAIKRLAGLPIYMPVREKAVIANVVGHNSGPLPDEAIRRLYERIIDETRRLERERTAALGSPQPDSMSSASPRSVAAESRPPARWPSFAPNAPPLAPAPVESTPSAADPA